MHSIFTINTGEWPSCGHFGGVMETPRPNDVDENSRYSTVITNITYEQLLSDEVIGEEPRLPSIPEDLYRKETKDYVDFSELITHDSAAFNDFQQESQYEIAWAGDKDDHRR